MMKVEGLGYGVVASAVLFADTFSRKYSYGIRTKRCQTHTANKNERYRYWATVAYFACYCWKLRFAIGACLDTDILIIYPAQSSLKANFREVVLWVRRRTALQVLQLSAWCLSASYFIFKLWPEQKISSAKSEECSNIQQLLHGLYYTTRRTA